MLTTDGLIARHKLDVDDYYRMVEAGILRADDRVELIDGEVIDMAPIGWDHAASVNGLNKALIIAFGDQAIVSVQNPVRLDRRNEPQPDFAVFRPRADRYRGGEPPGPSDVLLLIEVADTSLRFDRTVKLPLYARAGVAEVWIVDLRRRVLDAHRRPVGDTYAETASYVSGDVVDAPAPLGIRIKLAEIFE